MTSGREIVVEEEGDVAGSWDGDLLGEVLSNLVGNAVDHGAPSTRIEVAVVARDALVCLSVTNQGVTIPPDQCARIFEPFRRGASARPGNLGLGLYIASEIVRAHGGRIEVKSEAGVTTFTVGLPRARP